MKSRRTIEEAMRVGQKREAAGRELKGREEEDFRMRDRSWSSGYP